MSVLSKFGDKFGFPKSENRRQEEQLEEVAARKRKCHDRLELLKERIKLLENRARKKKQELDATKGQRRRVVMSEAKQILAELGKLGGEEKILLGQLNKLTTLESRISEIQVAGELAVAEDMVDDVALGLEEAHEQLVAEDRAVKDLEKIGYEGFEEDPEADIEAQLAELERDVAEEQAQTVASGEAAATEATEEAAGEDDIPAALKKQLDALEE